MNDLDENLEAAAAVAIDDVMPTAPAARLGSDSSQPRRGTDA